jgi:protein TonB
METYEESSVYKELSTVKEISIDEEFSIDKEISTHRELSIGKKVTIARELFHRLLSVSGGATLTLIFFLLLPLLQIITNQPATNLVLQSIDTANIPPPPPPLEAAPEKESEPQEKPPELMEAAPPLDLAQLEVALNPNLGVSDGWTAGDFVVKLNTFAGGAGAGEDVDALFSIADLDQTPRAIYQASPILNNELRKKAPGTVYVLFIVNQIGRVENPVVQKSSDTVFENPALTAVKQWKFEPGKRNGKAVRFRMRVPISFPKG